MTSTLGQLLDDAPLVVCLGPGGVGKTTVSSVLALEQAIRRRRSLVLTIDPAHRLADALGLPGLTNDPAEVTAFGSLHPEGHLSALMLDAGTTFDRMIERLVQNPERREKLLENRFYQHMSRSLAGTLEYMAVERLHALTRQGQFDRIVLDTPPTTSALDFLDAPDRVAAFFSERVTRWFTPSSWARQGSWRARLANRAGASALSLLSSIAGGEFVDETVQFFATFSDLLGAFRARGEEIGRMLRDPRTAFLIVCAPDLNRLAEAQEIDKRLEQAGCRARGFLVNRVVSGPLPEGHELAAAVEGAAQRLGVRDGARLAQTRLRFEELRRVTEAAAEAHGAVVSTLRRHAAGRAVYTAPLIEIAESPRSALLALHAGLFGRPSARVAAAANA